MMMKKNRNLSVFHRSVFLCASVVHVLFLTSCQDPLVIQASRIDTPKAIAAAFTDGGVDGDLFVVSVQRGEVAVIDISNAALVDLDGHVPGLSSIQVGLGVTDLATTPDGTFVYAVNGVKGELAKICTRGATGCTARTVTKRIALGSGIDRITMAGTRAYITRPTAGTVIVLDLTTDAVVTTIALGGSPRHVAVNASQTIAYVTDSAATTLARVTLNSLVVSRVDVGARTGTIALTPDDAFVYAVSLEKPEILVVATATDTQVNVNAADPTTTDKGIKFYSTTLGTFATPFSIAMRALSTPDTNSGSSVLAYVTTLDGFVYVVAPGGTAPHAIVDADTTSGPSVSAIAYSIAGTLAVAGADAPRPAGFDAGTTGITLTSTPRILKPETFSLTFEGALVSSTVSRNSPQATMLDGGVLLDVGQHFVKAGVIVGDHVTFTSTVSPASGADCTGVDVDGNGNRLEWPIASVAADRVTLQPTPPTACYTQATSYEIRATGFWSVAGSITTPLARLSENVPYDNSLFALTMTSGTSPSQRDARWAFSVSTGVVPTAFKLGTLLRGIVFAPTLARLYVVDEASRSVVEFDVTTGLALRVFR
ncbi:MAG: hypothetical protein HYY84_03610 [Deltaproteobacteria bacterium]|nr:hypothetical protein [Deltaproteobacteria bacterium]